MREPCAYALCSRTERWLNHSSAFNCPKQVCSSKPNHLVLFKQTQPWTPSGFIFVLICKNSRKHVRCCQHIRLPLAVAFEPSRFEELCTNTFCPTVIGTTVVVVIRDCPTLKCSVLQITTMFKVLIYLRVSSKRNFYFLFPVRNTLNSYSAVPYKSGENNVER